MRSEWLSIISTSFVALVFTLFPSNEWYQNYAPQWLLLTVLYWCIQEPHRVGLIYAWFLGLVLDVGTVGLLGANALLFTLSAALVLGLRQMLHVTGPIQQALFIAGLSIVYLLLSLWMQGGITDGMTVLSYLARAFSNLIAWPFMLFLFYLIRQRLS
ncbi:MAG: rod shape-determining protein MreD [Halothiobacillus sp.]